MVYLDYELAPSNRVYEQRGGKDLYALRVKTSSGLNFITNGISYAIMFGGFGYFFRKFYIPGDFRANATGLVCSTIMAAYLTNSFLKITMMYVGDINEYSILTKNENKMRHLFKMVEREENNKSFSLYQ